ncbi:uncharacterized protein LOC100455180 [Pongo abelii]|uniref:uncharacterized protein LOC100455180 n=1 Tax=Pongo abelii TaxID=9601 RepID=UPI0030044CE5
MDIRSQVDTRLQVDISPQSIRDILSNWGLGVNLVPDVYLKSMKKENKTGILSPFEPGDSFEPSRKHVRRKPYSTTKVTSGSTFKEVLRRYAVYTIQHRRHHDSWVKKKMYPQEDDFHHTVFSNLERLDKLQPTLEASEESLVHKDRGDGERPVNARVVQVAPLRCESSKLESLAKKTIWMPRKFPPSLDNAYLNLETDSHCRRCSESCPLASLVQVCPGGWPSIRSAHAVISYLHAPTPSKLPG